MTIRFDVAAPYEVDETDVPFARPDGLELLLDDNVPASITAAFVRAYRAAGGTVEHVHFPGAKHGFIVQASPDTEKCVALVREFIGAQLAGGSAR